MVRMGGMEGSVVGEGEGGMVGINSKEEEGKQGEHKLEETKARSKGEDRTVRAHLSD